MIARLTETFVHGVDLLEAEGRLARAHLARFALGGAAILVCAVVALAGVCGFLVGLVWMLSLAIGMPGALLIGGLVGAAGAAAGGIAIYKKLV